MGDETKTAITIYLHGSRRADVTIKYIPVIHSIRDHYTLTSLAPVVDKLLVNLCFTLKILHSKVLAYLLTCLMLNEMQQHYYPARKKMAGYRISKDSLFRNRKTNRDTVYN